MQGPFLMIAERIPDALTTSTFERDADRNIAGRDEP